MSLIAYLRNFFHEMPGHGYPGGGLDEFNLLRQLLESEDFDAQNVASIMFAIETIWIKSEHHAPAFRKKLQALHDGLEVLKQDWLKFQHIKAHPQQEASEDAQEAVREKQKPPEHKESSKKADEKDTEPTPREPPPNTAQAAASAMEITHDDGPFFQISRQTSGEPVPAKLPEPPTTASAGMFYFGDQYFPIKNRELQQAWRTLKYNQNEVRAHEISILRTINSISRKGFLSEFEYGIRNVNQLRPIVIIDRGESMAANDKFGEEIVNAAINSGMFPDIRRYYLTGLPAINAAGNEFWMNDRQGIPVQTVQQALGVTRKNDTIVLIYSDAGALKRELSPEELDKALRFVQRIYRYAKFVSWFNPVPAYRWNGQHLAALARAVPMYECSRTGFERALAALKGKVI